MGGSTIELASRFGCQATGLTLSRVQRIWATVSAKIQGVGERTRFRCADADKVQLPPRSFDVVWNVECSEHLFDKPAFFRRVAAWLKPGGRLALCAWLAGEGPGHERQVLDVCRYFLCPSLGTADDYLSWFVWCMARTRILRLSSNRPGTSATTAFAVRASGESLRTSIARPLSS
jgi:tocopherol O-methyltransferase